MNREDDKSMSSWGETHNISIAETVPERRWTTAPIYRTKLGAMYCGDSKHILRSDRLADVQCKAQLVFTSPPFPLNTKKKYGNLQGEEYIEWFAGFAPLLKGLLTPDGSIVIEIGNAWEPSRPVMSTTVLKALLRFLEKGGLNLCQEFVWYNPARLPSPVQWVNVERIRVKDAFTRIWWMSPNDRPKADNRRILREYSASMKTLIASGKYNSGDRPSQHRIGKTSFATNNSGAIPPNVIGGDAERTMQAVLNGVNHAKNHDDPPFTSLLKGTNTRSSESYQSFCREREIPLHPARMPPDLVEYFVRFLTDEGDLVLDPFGGSNTTGSVAETAARRWISIEAKWDYASSSIARFTPDQIKSASKYIDIDKIARKAANRSSSSKAIRA